ncbi:MAG: Vitamin B12 ABC transporter, permease protein BtuC [Ktedonobacterales bacterium]|nr:MAG: Vitamin B12 ABC transporter, permease protein BtuC [Ktedonobacterales bacterium]
MDKMVERVEGIDSPLAQPQVGAAPRPDGSAIGRQRGLLIRNWRVGILPLMCVGLFVAIVLAAAVGAVPISPLHTAAILLNQLPIFHFARHWPESEETILLVLRLPRVMGAALVGAALGVAGALFQGLLRNPLADPFLLGTSSGAALGASIAFAAPALYTAAWLGFGMVAVLAFVGALLAVALVYRFAMRGGQAPVVTLLLAGVAVSAILTAFQTLIISLNDRLGLHVVGLYLWLSGGITVENWTQVGVVLVIVVVGLVVALMLAPALDVFALGEDMAGYLGLRVERVKLLIVACAALLVAAAVAISGLVGFVGLVAPHLCRILLGPRHRLLIPATALAGAIFVVVADLFARTLAAPTELPLGVLTALVGGPFFLGLLRYAGQRYRW